MSEAPEGGAEPRNIPNLRVITSEIEGAAGQRVDGPEEPKPGAGGKSRRPVKPERVSGEIYPGCPVHALGVHGAVFYYQDILGQLAAVETHTKDRMRGVFGGRSELLIAQFPQWSKGTASTPPKVTGWAQEECATAMMRAAAEKGVWDASERVRGLGAWPDGEGGVAVHCGDRILYKGKWELPGLIDGYVYPSAPAVPRPATRAEAMEGDGPGLVSDLLEILRSWNWEPRGERREARDDVNAWLLLGWLGAATYAGALRWRPMIWITGDAGTGKSTLQELILELLGGEQAVLASSDPTEAGIRQVLAAGSQSTIPVLLDEAEAEEQNHKIQALIKLARQASSGATILRGGNDHRSHTFKVRSTFLFSSILVPPLLDQDISRIALLELAEMKRDAAPLVIAPKLWRRMGRVVAGRVLAQWGRLSETLERYRRALNRQGHSARGCDQYGILLAMADLAMHDELPEDQACDLWAVRLSSAVIVEQTDQARDWERMLNHVLGQSIEPYRSGQRYTLSRWMLAAAGVRDAPNPGDARTALPTYGLRVEGRGDKAVLIMATAHPGLAKLFEGTRWHAGSGQRGVWAQAAKRIPGATVAGTRSFDGVKSKAYAIPLASMPGLFGDDGANDVPQADHSPSDQGVGARNFDPSEFA